MNNGVNNINNVNESTNSREEIKAAKVYKLSPENAPKEIPQREEPVWLKKDKEKDTPPVQDTNPSINEGVVDTNPKVITKTPKHINIFTIILIVIIILMGLFIGFNNYNTNLKISRLNSLTSPVSTLNKEKDLALDSTVVLDLYSKVKTNIREDIAEPNLNESMKLYLSYRAIAHEKFYESNCNNFDNAIMLPFTCESSNRVYTPHAFKAEALKIEYNKLFGENPNFTYSNIQIGKNCIVGYQYIESRGEYVEGTCTENFTTTYKVNKELVSAKSFQDTITLKEKVKYSSSEGQVLPETLKSGNYIYTFKLDKNYNYILVDKHLEEE